MENTREIIKLSDIKRMSVGQIDFSEEFGKSEDIGFGDWYLAQTFATFSHKEACEFIFHVGAYEKDEEGVESNFFIDELKSNGFSDDFLNYCIEASRDGFKYLCFYS